MLGAIPPLPQYALHGGVVLNLKKKGQVLINEFPIIQDINFGK
jgi:hypothetical protein